MKLKLMFMFCLAFSMMMGNKLRAQVTFSGPATINSGDELEITAVGETAAYHIGSMPRTAAVDYTPYNSTVSNSLTYTSYFKSNNPTVPSRFKYKMENSSSAPIDVKITFMDVTMANSVDPATYNTNLKYTVTINPAPPVKKYYSSVQSGSFIKNDCTNSDGRPGPAVIYTVPANKYTSTTSQAAADALAIADLNANGQQNANIYGSCASEIRITLSSPDLPDENGDYPPHEHGNCSYQFYRCRSCWWC
ncbi:DUF5977 domain-containing protein [Pedobacter sp. NJ-S-72]